jgi:hypothetical protein
MAENAVGLFARPELALSAAEELVDAGFTATELMSPVPVEGVEEVLGRNKSAIKRFTFFGCIFGACFGFSLAAGTAMLYLHPTGGRPIITVPPFLIITYEMGILFGILATVIGFFISARLPAMSDRVYVPEASVDKFVVTVPCSNREEFDRAEGILRNADAEEIRAIGEVL